MAKKRTPKTSCLFLDIGGVLLTNGWDHIARAKVAHYFKLDLKDLEYRHHFTFNIYEQGKITLEEYLDWVIFYKKRSFSLPEFRKKMFDQSQAFPAMIQLIGALKSKYSLKIVAVSNEGRELNAYQIKKFELSRLFDSYISSCYVHIRKPDTELFELALDTSQVPIDRIVFIENTPLFVQVAESLKIRSILHTDARSTQKKLAALGLSA